MFLRAEGYPENGYVNYLTGVMFRKTGSVVTEFLSREIKKLIKEYSKQCEIYISYLLWKYPPLLKHIHVMQSITYDYKTHSFTNIFKIYPHLRTSEIC